MWYKMKKPKPLPHINICGRCYKKELQENNIDKCLFCKDMMSVKTRLFNIDDYVKKQTKSYYIKKIGSFIILLWMWGSFYFCIDFLRHELLIGESDVFNKIYRCHKKIISTIKKNGTQIIINDYTFINLPIYFIQIIVYPIIEITIKFCTFGSAIGTAINDIIFISIKGWETLWMDFWCFIVDFNVT